MEYLPYMLVVGAFAWGWIFGRIEHGFRQGVIKNRFLRQIARNDERLREVLGWER